MFSEKTLKFNEDKTASENLVNWMSDSLITKVYKEY